MVKQLEVMLWGQRVGTLIAPDDHRGRILFYFDKEFTRHGYDIARAVGECGCAKRLAGVWRAGAPVQRTAIIHS